MPLTTFNIWSSWCHSMRSASSASFPNRSMPSYDVISQRSTSNSKRKNMVQWGRSIMMRISGFWWRTKSTAFGTRTSGVWFNRDNDFGIDVWWDIYPWWQACPTLPESCVRQCSLGCRVLYHGDLVISYCLFGQSICVMDHFVRYVCHAWLLQEHHWTSSKMLASDEAVELSELVESSESEV